MDPWEVVKWIAIFRLILPGALFRLCGGRVENLGELQAEAVRAGLNGVMMGNFLTTLGNTPDEDRTMFEELGLNVGRQPDNGSNPRPDNRSGWLDGETPDVVAETLAARPALEVRLWDPGTQLRFSAKRFVPPRPDGAPNAGRGRVTREALARQSAGDLAPAGDPASAGGHDPRRPRPLTR
jgi:biotin synthase